MTGPERPAPEPTDRSVTIDPIDSETQTLPNGLTVHRVSRPAVDCPAVVLRFATTLSHEKRVVAEILFAAMAEHVRDATPSAVRVRSVVTDHGAQLVAAGDVFTLLRAFEGALQPGAFDGDDITRLLARKIVDDATRFRYDAMETALYRAHYGALHPRARDSSTNTRTMLDISFDVFDAHANAILVPALGTLVIVASPETWASLPDPLPLGTWSALAATERPSGPRAAAEPSSITTTTFHVFGGGGDGRTYFLTLHRGPSRRDPDFAAFGALCDSLGAFTSSANLEFRHRQGRTYGLHTWLVASDEGSECFFGGLIGDHEVLELYERHRAQITRWTNGEIDPSLAERATRRAWMAWAARYESSDRVAMWIAEHGSPGTHVPISTDDLARAAHRHFSATGWHVALATQSRAVYRKLGQRGRVQLYEVSGGE